MTIAPDGYFCNSRIFAIRLPGATLMGRHTPHAAATVVVYYAGFSSPYSISRKPSNPSLSGPSFTFAASY